MKAWKTLVFIFSIIAVLAGISSVFPQDGLKVSPSVTFHFPSITDIAGEDPAVTAAARAEDERLAAERLAWENDYAAFFNSAPSRFFLPGDDLTFFDDLFEAFEDAGRKRMRIVHYGDSQIEMDRMSDVIRDSLQGRFGGMGPGLVPFKDSYYTRTICSVTSGAFSRYACFGLDSAQRASHGRYGPRFEMARSFGDVHSSFYPNKTNTLRSRRFNTLTVVSRNESGRLTLRCSGRVQEQESGTDTRFTRFELPEETERARLDVSGDAELYGVMLDGRTGVCLDNIGMRGCSGTVFAGVSSRQLKDYFTGENVRLIIFQFGGNAMPAINSDRAASLYARSLVRHLEALKSMAPSARIVFVGPSDMATMHNGRLQTYPKLPALVDSLKTVSAECGAAYWDFYSAMGGSGSIIAWNKARPQLAASDYVHLTNRGVDEIGKMFYQSLMKYYDYYLWRKRNGAGL